MRGALRLVYNNENLSFDELLDLDNSVSNHHRNLQRLTVEMYKVKNKLSTLPMQEIPNSIKESASLIEFKAKIKKWKPNGCTCRLCKTFIHHLGFIH